ncbi:MAG: DUF4433 domain-containing protein [Myxococcales bacterium]|nr:DUF4433 domain-containing protein [Myxococcales bacterium]
MTEPPSQPKAYDITHASNLKGIVAAGALRCDSTVAAAGGPNSGIGIADIKSRRRALPVRCHPGLTVGDCVPFYLCPRSIMLFVLYRGNHVQLDYRGGQDPIVHLEIDMRTAVAWAQSAPRRWAVTPRNAATVYNFDFFSDLSQLSLLNWDAIAAQDFRDPEVKEAKQAEFLLEELCPWELVSQVGVYNASTKAAAEAAIGHQPPVVVRRDWYF